MFLKIPTIRMSLSPKMVGEEAGLVGWIFTLLVINQLKISDNSHKKKLKKKVKKLSEVVFIVNICSTHFGFKLFEY